MKGCILEEQDGLHLLVDDASPEEKGAEKEARLRSLTF